MSRRAPRLRFGALVRRGAPILIVLLLVAGCSSANDSAESTSPTTAPELRPELSPDPVEQSEPGEEPEPGTAAESQDTFPLAVVDAAKYLPAWVPDGYSIESVTSMDPPEEIRVAQPEAGETLLLGDNSIVSDTSIWITARRFASADDLAHAVWVEDALMVQSGGPESTMNVEGAVFVYDGLPGMDGNAGGGQFHAVIGDVLVTGFILGPLEQERREQLLSSLILEGDGVTVSIDHDAGGLIELERAESGDPADRGYEVAYSKGTSRFSLMMMPGSSEASIAAGSFSRSSERFDGEIGSGYLEAQPEVAGALGALRLVWWVPEVRIQMWFGGSDISEEDAVRIADSVALIDERGWSDATDTASFGRIDYGVMNLPEDPAAAYEARQGERERSPDEIGARPEIDVQDIASFIGDMRGAELPGDLSVQWLAPIEADTLTSGVSFLPATVGSVLVALHAARASDGGNEAAEARRQDVRGLCCSLSGIQLVEGMETDEAAVVAAHEFTHYFDTRVAGARFSATTELFDAGQALREGNANRVMIAYRDARGLRYDPQNRPHLQSFLRVGLKRALRFAYWDGQAFAEALAAAGGEEAIDRALTDRPPLSSEHILHPDHYLAGDVPLPVDPPEGPPDVTVTDRGTLGAFVIALAAEPELGWTDAVELAGEWAGDGFVLWSEGFRSPCLAATIVFDSEAAAERFVAAVDGTTTGPAVNLEMCARNA